MYRLASKGLITPPCGVPQVLPFPPLTRGVPSSSRSSTGTFNHILIRRSMSRSTILRAIHGPPHRLWLIRLGAKVFPDAAQPFFQPLRFDSPEALSIHARRALIGLCQCVGMGQKVFPVHLVVEQIETVVRFFLRLLVQLPLKHPDLHWCFQAHRQSPLLSFFRSASEVRALSSTGVTRLHRSYDPLRLPDRPSSYRGCWRCDLHQRRISPNYSDRLPCMPCSVPRRTEQVRVGFFPVRAAFPV